MTLNYKKQSQFELFPSATDQTPSYVSKSSRSLKDLTLSLENIIVLGIVSVMVVVFFFSMGVERGKRLAGVVGENIPAETLKSAIINTSKTADLVEPQQKVILNVDLRKETVEEKREILNLPPELKQEKQPEEFSYTIQVASFKQEKSAKEEASTLKDVGHESFVLPKGSYSIVCVGKFSEKTQAEQYTQKIKQRYKDYIIRRM